MKVRRDLQQATFSPSATTRYGPGSLGPPPPLHPPVVPVGGPLDLGGITTVGWKTAPTWMSDASVGLAWRFSDQLVVSGTIFLAVVVSAPRSNSPRQAIEAACIGLTGEVSGVMTRSSSMALVGRPSPKKEGETTARSNAVTAPSLAAHGSSTRLIVTVSPEPSTELIYAP
ncbi:uncharacterized protein ATNIH1004_004887 [Aspergillus tanneri]|uniref:Uncharacterized protein n=1 Tax=Aspergillus tanneri TaxID=1220188 RepID=A0A5M9N364_9EURO|nr:uncharacterized protein ATNIH1004_004887 [Aspergillus tanneri]KAA8648997.1 hypothetical protein ATNIH1004_004887 [Aspergillus tanneri]